MTRKELREHIFKMVFQIEFNEAGDMSEHLDLYLGEFEEATDKDIDYIKKKYEAIADRVEEIDVILNEASAGWKTSRMNKVDLAILRLAVYELKWDEDIPKGVAINEAVELAKKFSGESAPAFINGVLAKIVED